MPCFFPIRYIKTINVILHWIGGGSIYDFGYGWLKEDRC